MNYEIITINVLGFVNSIIVSIFILLFGFLIAKIGEKVSNFLLSELRIKKILKEGFNTNINFNRIISKSIYYVLSLMTVYLALESINLSLFVIILWFSFILIVIVLSISLDIKDIILNFYYGFRLNNKILRVGNNINTKYVKGKILERSFLGIRVQHKLEILKLPNIYLVKEFSK